MKDGKVVLYKGKYTKTKRLENEDKEGKRVTALLGDIIQPKEFLRFLVRTIYNKIVKKEDTARLGTANTAVGIIFYILFYFILFIFTFFIFFFYIILFLCIFFFFFFLIIPQQQVFCFGRK